MKTLLVFLAVAVTGTASVFAWRALPPPTTAQLVSQSPWIFAGRVLRCESSSAGSPIGTAHVTFTILAGLPLRGTPPKQVVLIGLRDRPFTVPTNPGKVLIFFAHPMDTLPGFDGTYADVRPFADLKLVQMLLEKQPK